MKALVGAFNQEKAVVGAFSVIVQLTDGSICGTIRDTISRHIIPLPDQSRPLQSPPDMFRDEQSLRYPANRWNAGIIICNICTVQLIMKTVENIASELFPNDTL